MKQRHRFILFVILFFSFSSMKAQGVSGPPAFKPIAENTRLIDSIIKITNYEAYFIQYCIDRVENYAKSNNWSQSQKEKILRTINFQNFSFLVHNAYGAYTTDDLKKLIGIIGPINQKLDDFSKITLSNYTVAINLEVHIDNIVKGKYIRDK